jgi:(hydroxyamino)benzene mutase
MTALEKRLCLAGVVLFFFGLLLGFFVTAFPNKDAVLAAHETALGSGTFLIAMGLLWNKLVLSPKWSWWSAQLLWISFFVLEAGLTLGATTPGASVSSPRSAAQAIAGLLNAVGAILLFVVVAAVLIALARSKPKVG